MDYQNKIKSKGNSNSKSLLSIMAGCVITIFMILIVAVALSFISLKFKNPARFSPLFSVLSVIIGAFFSGIINSFMNKNKSQYNSMISAFISSLAIFIFSLCNDGFSYSIIINPIIILFCSFITSLIMEKENKKKKINKYLR